MSVGADIANVFKDVGAKVFINNTEEYDFIDAEVNAQVSNPFIREHMIEGTLPFNTNIKPGDIIRFETTDERYLIVNFIPDIFENQVVAISATLYKCNVFAKIYREQETQITDDVPMNQRHKRQVCWSKKNEGYFVFTSALRGNTSEMLGTQDLGDITIKHNMAYLPSSVQIRPKDRFYIDKDEYYTVGDVEKRRFNNVSVISLMTDTRHTNYCPDEDDSSVSDGGSS
ncbi:MAG: hypothetical protein ACOCZ4_00350 [Bacteroidota bacterium]